MITKSTTRIHAQTTPVMKERFRQRLVANIQRFVGADYKEIDQRIEELDREWSVERAVEVEAPAMIGIGAALGLLHNKKWFLLSGFAASMVVLHNTRGAYPLLPVLQRLGLRPQKDIEDERNALRVLRRDHERYLRR